VNEWERVPQQMLHAKARWALLFRQLVLATLKGAGILEAETGWDEEEGVPTCTRTGFHLYDWKEGSGRVVNVAILGRTDVTDPVRQAERDGVAQQAYAALTAAGFDVRINEHGHLKVSDRRTLEQLSEALNQLFESPGRLIGEGEE